MNIGTLVFLIFFSFPLYAEINFQAFDYKKFISEYRPIGNTNQARLLGERFVNEKMYEGKDVSQYDFTTPLGVLFKLRTDDPEIYEHYPRSFANNLIYYTNQNSLSPNETYKIYEILYLIRKMDKYAETVSDHTFYYSLYILSVESDLSLRHLASKNIAEWKDTFYPDADKFQKKEHIDLVIKSYLLEYSPLEQLYLEKFLKQQNALDLLEREIYRKKHGIFKLVWRDCKKLFEPPK